MENDEIMGRDELGEGPIGLSDLAPVIADLELAPHGAIVGLRTVNQWPLTRDEKLELVWLAGKLVESKHGMAEDIEEFLEELHRLHEAKICSCKDYLKTMRDLVGGFVGRYGFQEINTGT